MTTITSNINAGTITAAGTYEFGGDAVDRETFMMLLNFEKGRMIEDQIKFQTREIKDRNAQLAHLSDLLRQVRKNRPEKAEEGGKDVTAQLPSVYIDDPAIDTKDVDKLYANINEAIFDQFFDKILGPLKDIRDRVETFESVDWDDGKKIFTIEYKEKNDDEKKELKLNIDIPHEFDLHFNTKIENLVDNTNGIFFPGWEATPGEKEKETVDKDDPGDEKSIEGFIKRILYKCDNDGVDGKGDDGNPSEIHNFIDHLDGLKDDLKNWLCDKDNNPNLAKPPTDPEQDGVALKNYLLIMGYASGSLDNLTQGDFDKIIENIKAKMDELNNQSELDMTRMNSLTSKYNQVYDMTSNFISKEDKTRGSLIRNWL